MNMPERKPLVIEQPKLQTRAQRVGYFVLTIMLWSFWVYLWLPLMATWQDELDITWLLDHHWFTREDYQFILTMIVVVAISSIIISVVMGLWAYYNFRRFSKNRRRRPTVLDSGKVADYFLVDSHEIDSWHQAKRLRVEYLENGKLERVDIIEGGKPVQAALPLWPNDEQR